MKGDKLYEPTTTVGMVIEAIVFLFAIAAATIGVLT